MRGSARLVVVVLALGLVGVGAQHPQAFARANDEALLPSEATIVDVPLLNTVERTLLNPLTFKLGVLSPLSGALNSLGPSMQNAARLAVHDINEAGVGITVEAVYADDRTTDTVAIQASFRQLVEEGVTAIAGPCCSGITHAILDSAMAARVVIASPSASYPSLTERENDGYFWRVSPTERGEGAALAQLVRATNVTAVNLIVVDSDLERRVSQEFAAEFANRSGTIVATTYHNAWGSDLSSVVAAACSGPTDVAFVFVSHMWTVAEMLRTMDTLDCRGSVDLFGSTSVYWPGSTFVQDAGKDSAGRWLAEGFRGIMAQKSGERFVAPYRAAYGEDPVQFAAESYDAVVYLALAALQANSVRGEDYRQELASIANPPGHPCESFKSCARLINLGIEIDYIGMAHDLVYTEKGEPASGDYVYWIVTPEGDVEITQTNVRAYES